MIVRISGEAQYRIAPAQTRRLDALDDATVTAVETGDDTEFRDRLTELLGFVRSVGRRLDDEELAASDVILPPADLTLDEARREFTGEGLIPD